MISIADRPSDEEQRLLILVAEKDAEIAALRATMAGLTAAQKVDTIATVETALADTVPAVAPVLPRRGRKRKVDA